MIQNFTFYKLTFVFFCIIIYTVPGFTQVNGCKDPLANNYNASATVNDGSCMYNVTNYTPPSKVDPLNSLLIETSGLQFAGNYLWSFNDGGGAAAIYRIDTLTNTILQTVNIGGATNTDWEDIAFDGIYFYIGDFGNNANGARTDLKIYKFALSAIPDHVSNPTATISPVQVEIINFIYSDQPQPPVATAANQTKFDCEAMIAAEGKLHLFSKNWIDLTSTHYIIDKLTAGTDTALPAEVLTTGYLVTAADKAAGQQIVALLGYQTSGFGSHFLHLLTDYSGGNYFNGNKRKINLPDATIMGQAEGITFRNGEYGYISNERLFTITPKLRSFNTSAFVPQYVLPLKLKSFIAAEINGTHKITWSFNASVRDLQIQYSADGLDFAIVKTYRTSISGSLVRNPDKQLNYYRLAWQNEEGALEYSNIISLKRKETNRIGGFLLKSNGDLYFTINSSSPVYYSFTLTLQDGRSLSTSAERSYLAGSNKITFSKKLLPGNLVFISAISNDQKTTSLIQVEK